VARTADEAEAQARGEDLTGNQDEREEIRRAAEELFEQAEADAAAEEEGEDCWRGRRKRKLTSQPDLARHAAGCRR
jgi:hypothetical protein